MVAAEMLVGIDNEPVVVKGLDLVILILEIKHAVIILEGPEEGEAVSVMMLVPGAVFFQGAGAVRPKDDGIIFFKTNDTGVERVEAGGVFICRLGIKAGLFVFPGGAGEEVHVMMGRALTAA
jgi:hypothetical protein